MTSRKAAFFGVGVALLASYFAAANMPSQEFEPARDRPARPNITPGALAVEVSSQAARLQSRMAQAPLPESNPRNPFSFGVAPRAPQPSPRTVHAAVAALGDEPLGPAGPPPPVLSLIGIAEETSPGGPRRTAVIGGEGDHLFMVREGDVLGGAYKVKKIGADAVELEDVTTKAFRRLALR